MVARRPRRVVTVGLPDTGVPRHGGAPVVTAGASTLARQLIWHCDPEARERAREREREGLIARSRFSSLAPSRPLSVRIEATAAAVSPIATAATSVLQQPALDSLDAFENVVAFPSNPFPGSTGLALWSRIDAAAATVLQHSVQHSVHIGGRCPTRLGSLLL